jgi:hypothetical protein
MKRSIFATILGLVTWAVVVSVIDRVIRLALPGYTAAEKTIEFTLTMKFARLLMAAMASLAAGAVAQYISRANRWVPAIIGFLVLAMFVPAHIVIWTRLPVWYHLTFLLTIVPLVMLGARLIPVASSGNLAAPSPSPAR